tara:strand:- start:2021 stop:2539 length:519 start_codon:yes stop_codon:yes gene_type:complete
MILDCNSCGKKFVVPDNAITASGRMVQCGSCGNKWRQFPINKATKTSVSPKPKTRSIGQNIQKTKKTKKTFARKPREINLYSPEYLAKKHGIKLNETKPKKVISKTNEEKISFGFYSSLILLLVFSISIFRILYFSQDFIVANFPLTEFYLNYFFESIRNIFEIWKDLVTGY